MGSVQQLSVECHLGDCRERKACSAAGKRRSEFLGSELPRILGTEDAGEQARALLGKQYLATIGALRTQ